MDRSLAMYDDGRERPDTAMSTMSRSGRTPGVKVRVLLFCSFYS
jgi:hypothetical protein